MLANEKIEASGQYVCNVVGFQKTEELGREATLFHYASMTSLTSNLHTLDDHKTVFVLNTAS